MGGSIAKTRTKTRLKISRAGAGEGNRTLVISLEGFCSTIELHPPAWSRNKSSPKIVVRPLARPPALHHCNLILSVRATGLTGGGGWIRTNVGARPTVFHSAPFSRSATPRAEPEIMWIFRRLVKKKRHHFRCRSEPGSRGFAGRPGRCSRRARKSSDFPEKGRSPGRA